MRWLSFVSHEYFHAFNVKRLRPVELGPFDYEHPPSTKSLWISEGLTTYFGDLILVRAGLVTPQDALNLLSTHIGQLQNSRGRLVQSLEKRLWMSGARARRASAGIPPRSSATMSKARWWGSYSTPGSVARPAARRALMM